MKTSLPLLGMTCLALAGRITDGADEARVSLYVVDRSAEFAETGGACLPYTPQEAPGPHREILAIAKGPPGSTVVMLALDRGAPHLGLAPVVSAQDEASQPVRFPAAGSTWPFTEAPDRVELHVAVFHQADPEVARIAEYAGWLDEALKAKNEVEILLHAEAIQKRLANLLRQRNVDEYRVKFGDGFSSLRLPPSSKAAVTRGGTDSLLESAKREAKSPIAAVRRGMKTLDDEWLQDSRVIPVAPAAPGMLVFPIAAPGPK